MAGEVIVTGASTLTGQAFKCLPHVPREYLQASPTIVMNGIHHYTTIQAPIDGLIGFLAFDKGNVVGPNQNPVLATMSTIDPIEVSFGISEVQYLNFVWRTGAVTSDKPVEVPFELTLADGSVYTRCSSRRWAATRSCIPMERSPPPRGQPGGTRCCPFRARRPAPWRTSPRPPLAPSGSRSISTPTWVCRESSFSAPVPQGSRPLS